MTASLSSFCWGCGRRFMIATTGASKGHLTWSVVVDQIGNEHRVHKRCFDLGALDEGVKFVRDESEPADAPRRKMQVWR